MGCDVRGAGGLCLRYLFFISVVQYEPDGRRVEDLGHALQHGLEGEADLSGCDGVRVSKRVDVEVPGRQQSS